MEILDELEARGLVQDVTHKDELGALLAAGPICFYTGYDPTATSLHLGSLVQVTAQVRLQRAGHQPIVLVGGATGMIGDPSGKSAERNLLDEDALAANVAAVRAQLSRFLHFGDGPSDAILVNNHDWFGEMGFLAMLRDVGKHISVNYMIAKESVKSRLEDREQGISYTEFSYMLLQAYDFVHLSRTHGVRLQVGGSDQWGNITAGTELSRKLGGESLYGIVTPLIVDSSGQKMGKTSTGNNLWVDPDRTSPYAFYQYLLNVDDADVEKLLKIFGWRPLDEIEEVLAAHREAPHKRDAQRELANGLTTWVHGEEACRRAVAAGQVMFGGSLEELTDADLEPLLGDLPSSELARAELEGGMPLVELLARTGLAASKGAARRVVTQGGAYVNNVRVDDAKASVSLDDLGTETMIVLRSGKKSWHVVKVI